jgi:PAS domain S-box-containing protein
MKKNKIIKLRIILFFAIIVYLFLFFFYIKNVWNDSLEEKSRRVKDFTKTIEIGLSGEMIKLLTSTPQDIGSIPYGSIKDRLVRFKQIDKEVFFVYLMAKRDEKIYFMADSEPGDSKNYSYPGQYFQEAESIIYDSFEKNEIIITKPTIDRWGTWVSVLAPIKNNEGQTVAVLGIDYPADEWTKQAIFSASATGLIGTIILVIFILFYIIIEMAINSKIKEQHLEKNKMRYESLIKQSRTFIWEVDLDLKYIYVSDNSKDIIGYNPTELVGKKTVFDLHPKEGLEKFKEDVLGVIKRKEKINNLENPMVTKKGEVVWVLSSGVPVLDKNGTLKAYRGSDMDITERKKSVDDMQKINKFMIGRELRMIDLKKEIVALKEQLRKNQ